MLLRKYLYLAVLFLALAGPASADGIGPATYLSVIDDVPLIDGLTEMTDNAFAFDKPEGRIAETVAQGTADTAFVESFYRATLPQLGWQAQGPGVWTRDKEKITLRVERRDNVTYARFTLSPVHE